MTNEEFTVQRWGELIAPHLNPQIDRLMLELSLDPSVPVAVTDRPEARLELIPYRAYLRVPCSSEASAKLLAALSKQWDWWFLPFRGDLKEVVFVYPGGELAIVPTDPRAAVVEAAYRQLLEPLSCPVLEVEINPRSWVSTSQLLGARVSSYSESDIFPSLAIGVEGLRSLSALYQHWDILHRFALAAVPELVRFACLVALPDGMNSPEGEVAFEWWLEDGCWGFSEQRLSLELLARLLLVEAGLAASALEGVTEACISEGELLVYGSTTAVEAVKAIVPDLILKLKQLRRVPVLNLIHRLLLCPPGPNETIQLVPSRLQEVER